MGAYTNAVQFLQHTQIWLLRRGYIVTFYYNLEKKTAHFECNLKEEDLEEIARLVGIIKTASFRKE